jgi:hypothetical protein
MLSERYIAVNKRESIKQDSFIKRLIVEDKQKCLACRKSIALVNGKLVKMPNLQSRSEKYKHANNCSQEGKF